VCPIGTDAVGVDGIELLGTLLAVKLLCNALVVRRQRSPGPNGR